MKRSALAGALALAALVSLSAVVMGHAALQSSDPASGATIKTPYTLTATYDEELTPNGSSIVVQAANGNQVASGTVSTADAKVMTIDLPVLPEGTYTVLWTAVTADDLGVTRGTYQFTAGAAASAAPPSASATNGQASGGGNDVAIALVLAAVIVGGVLGFLFLRNRR